MCGEVGHFCVVLRVVVFGRSVSLSAVCPFPINAVCETCSQFAHKFGCDFWVDGFVQHHQLLLRTVIVMVRADTAVLLQFDALES